MQAESYIRNQLRPERNSVFKIQDSNILSFLFFHGVKALPVGKIEKKAHHNIGRDEIDELFSFFIQENLVKISFVR